MFRFIRSLPQLFHKREARCPQFFVTGTTVRKGAEFWKVMQDDVCVLMVHVKCGQIRYKGDSGLCSAMRATLVSDLNVDNKKDQLINDALAWHRSAPLEVISYEVSDVKSL